MRILLTGTTGQVGRELLPRLQSQHEVVPTARRPLSLAGASGVVTLDLADASTIRSTIRAIRPDVLVHAAAWTQVDRAEREPALATAINATATATLADESARLGVSFVYVSTDYVFDGSGVLPWKETDRPAPLNVYGLSKLAGEHAVRRCGASHAIIRTSWLYGPQGTNFVTKLLERLQQVSAVPVVIDQVGSPTPAWLVADVITTVVNGWTDRRLAPNLGLLHLSAAGETSWYHFAQQILSIVASSDPRFQDRRIIPIHSAELAQHASRPANCRLDCTKLVKSLEITLPHWRQGLAATLPAILARMREGSSRTSGFPSDAFPLRRD